MIMKEKKRKEIIESAIKLIAKRGYHVTSVQDIVNECGISKGAFYNYFSSKEELYVEIFKYYFDSIKSRMAEIEKEKISPRERMIKQIHVPFEQVKGNKDSLVIFLREHNFSNQKEIKEYMKKAITQLYQWYRKSLLAVYGHKIHPYIGDIIFVLEGIRKNFMTAILFHQMEIDTERVAKFIMNRADELVSAFENGEQPLIDESEFLKEYLQETPVQSKEMVEEARHLLLEMKNLLPSLKNKHKKQLEEVINILLKEIEKKELDTIVFQGVLANLKIAKEFDLYREKLAKILNIQLL